MSVGANYVPRRGWFHSWLDFDVDQVREDLDDLVELGLDHIRIFPLWELVQPNPGLIRESALMDVRTLACEASERGLGVSVDVLQGHLSSFDFLPAWTRTWHASNIFTDPEVIEAESRLMTAFAQCLSDVPGATGLSVGNEIVQFAAHRHPEAAPLTTAQAASWLTAMFEAMRSQWPHGRHTFSYDDDVFFDPTHPFTPDLIAMGDLVTVHSWVFGTVGRHHGKDHPRLALFARYLLEVAHAWAPGKPLWLQEIGAPLTYVSQDEVPDFVRKTLSHASCVPQNRMVTWWCSANVSPSLTRFPEVEYGLGLFDADGHLTPAGRALRDWVKHPEVAPAASGANALAIPAPTDPGARRAVSPDGALFDSWATAIETGTPLTLEVQ
ncbi:hypothetical protein I6B53_02445 [Schaalia sp. 19OD2882]|nr:hypothetical protein I6B53_02445 [Schaalia sp. 19OD2882]